MMNFTQLVILGVLVESIVSGIFWLQEGGWQAKRIAAAIVALLLAVLTGADLFAFIGMPLAGYIPATVGLVAGIVCAALVFMRGANYVADLLKLILKAIASLTEK